MKQIVLLGLAFVWALSACGGDKPAERAKQVASVAHLRTYTEAIAHDSCEGRRPFSVGADRAVGYIAEQMKAVGLQPVSGESYFQPVPIISSRTVCPEPMRLRTPKQTLSL